MNEDQNGTEVGSSMRAGTLGEIQRILRLDHPNAEACLREIRDVLAASPVTDRDDEPEKLRALIRVCQIHSGYPDCGYLQMTTAQKALYDRIRGEYDEDDAPDDDDSRARASSGEPEQGERCSAYERRGRDVVTCTREPAHSGKCVFPEQGAALTDNPCVCGHDVVAHDRDPHAEGWCGLCWCAEFRAALTDGDAGAEKAGDVVSRCACGDKTCGEWDRFCCYDGSHSAENSADPCAQRGCDRPFREHVADADGFPGCPGASQAGDAEVARPAKDESLEVDRAWICVERALNCHWIASGFCGAEGLRLLYATIRIALDTEVRACGPFLDRTLEPPPPPSVPTLDEPCQRGHFAATTCITIGHGSANMEPGSDVCEKYAPRESGVSPESVVALAPSTETAEEQAARHLSTVVRADAVADRLEEEGDRRGANLIRDALYPMQPTRESLFHPSVPTPEPYCAFHNAAHDSELCEKRWGVPTPESPMRTHGLSVFDCFPELDTATITQGEVRKRLHQWERLSAWYQTDRAVPLEPCPSTCEHCRPMTAPTPECDGDPLSRTCPFHGGPNTPSAPTPEPSSVPAWTISDDDAYAVWDAARTDVLSTVDYRERLKAWVEAAVTLGIVVPARSDGGEADEREALAHMAFEFANGCTIEKAAQVYDKGVPVWKHYIDKAYAFADAALARLRVVGRDAEAVATANDDPTGRLRRLLARWEVQRQHFATFPVLGADSRRVHGLIADRIALLQKELREVIG